MVLAQVCCSPALAQYKMEFSYLNVDNGLSQNTVRTIYQDERGYLWIGTDDGLSLYDGETAQKFSIRTEQSQRLGSNEFVAFPES